MFRAGFFDHHRPAEGKTVTADSNGVASAFYGPCPEGYAWYVERISSHCPTAGTNLSVFVSASETSTDFGGRVDWTTDASDAVADEFNAIYVPAGYFLVLRWDTATSADVCQASVQTAVHQLNPARITSRMDEAQIRSAHEHDSSPVTLDAVGPKAA